MEYGNEFAGFIKKSGTIFVQNAVAYQGLDPQECGKFCLMYIYYRLRYVNGDKIYKMFSSNLKK